VKEKGTHLRHGQRTLLLHLYTGINKHYLYTTVDMKRDCRSRKGSRI